MLCTYGMDDELGMVYIDEETASNGEMAMLIHRKVSGILKEQLAQTVALLTEERARLERLVNLLLEKNSLTGEEIDAKVSVALLENIFFKNTPLHDGAVIVTKGKIQAASCILPVSAAGDIPKKYGLRHHAAMGIAQQTDAVAVVVSEESGQIALAHNAKLRERLSTTELERLLQDIMIEKKPKPRYTPHRKQSKKES
jgi:DNA integrity scanning protein DisA with diadenylate cyclase activity